VRSGSADRAHAQRPIAVHDSAEIGFIVLTLSVRWRDRTADLDFGSAADTVSVTKRTMALALAAGLAALTVSGCGARGAAGAANPPAAQQLADVAATPAADDATPAGDDATPTADDAEATDPAPADTPETVTRTVTRTKAIAFATRTVKDSTLAKGKKVTRTAGRAGLRTVTYRVTVADGKQTGEKLVSSVVTRKPVTKVVAIGTKAAGGGGDCDPNYSGACVPIASDVDCAGGSGNGPAYVDGPVRVIGDDIYDLDRDGDGVACDT
jgi:hypothetical protein